MTTGKRPDAGAGAYDEGRKAFFAGRERNPSSHFYRDDWLFGWDQARDAAMAKSSAFDRLELRIVEAALEFGRAAVRHLSQLETAPAVGAQPTSEMLATIEDALAKITEARKAE